MAVQPEHDVDNIELARQALSDSPMYVEHIGRLFGDCAALLRAGDDQVAMINFARAADDLNQFVQLIGHMRGAAAADASTSQEVDSFSTRLHECVGRINDALTNNDLVAVGDHIEESLLPLLPSWTNAAQELSIGIGV